MKTECQFVSDTAAFVSGELSPDEHSTFEKHIQECATCSAAVQETRRLLERLRAVPSLEVSADLCVPILERIRPRRVCFWRWAAPVAAAVAVLVGGLLVRFPANAPSQTVNRALDWFCKVQEADGSWDAAKWGGFNQFKVALSALPTLALACLDSQAPERVAAIEHAAAWLQKQQSAPGVFGPSFIGAPYNQSIATLALLHVYQVRPECVSKPMLDAALGIIISRQCASGGWGYLRSPFADRSITEWHIETLRLASELGWASAAEPLKRAELWLKANPSGSAPEPLDSPSELIGNTGGMDFQRAYLLSEKNRRFRDFQARRQMEGLRKLLVRSQEMAGQESGSWAPIDRWGRAGGRLYSTAMASLAIGEAGF